jgi:hypothetical protein
MSSENTLVLREQGGSTLRVKSGGAIIVEGGGALGVAASVTTTATPATGSCGVQFVFKDAAGVAIATPIAGICYQSTIDGLTQSNAITSIAVLTNGSYTSLVTGKIGTFTTTAAGLLGLTLTASAGTYYITFVMPSGALLTSSALVVN